MDNTSTTDTDNSASAIVDPNVSTDQGTGDSANNSDSSQSTVNVASDTTNTTNTDGNPTSAFDSDLDEWIEKRGLKADSDEQRKAYQDLRNDQREYTKSRQAQKDADNAKALNAEISKINTDANEDDDDLDPLEKDVKILKASLAKAEESNQQRDFYETNKVTDEQHKAILDVMREKFAKATTPESKKAAIEYWTKPDALGDLLDLAKARLMNNTDTSLIAEEAARKERERIAKESNASSPGRGAKTTTTGDKTPEAERLARFSTWD